MRLLCGLDGPHTGTFKSEFWTSNMPVIDHKLSLVLSRT
jgi:hypothetical protein